MKITIINDTMDPSNNAGAENVALDLATAYSHAGHEVQMFATSPHPETQNIESIPLTTFQQPQTTERWRGWTSLKNKKLICSTLTHLKKTNCQKVHLHNIHHYFSWNLISALRESQIKTVITLHDSQSISQTKATWPCTPQFDSGQINYKKPLLYDWQQSRFRWNPFRDRQIQKALANADHRVAVSHALQKLLTHNNIKDVSVIHNGVDLNFWQPPQESTIQNHPTNYEHPTLLYAGRLSPPKGSQVLAQALLEEWNRGNKWHLIIVSHQDNNTEDLIQRTQNTLPITVTGWRPRSQMDEWISQADLVAIPSLYWDPFPTITLEAQALGKPVIATIFGGSKEAVLDNETGWLINPHSPDDWKEAFQKYAQCNREKLSQKAKAHISQNFNLKEVAASYLKLFEVL